MRDKSQADVPQEVPKILKNSAEDKKLWISFQTLTKENTVKKKRKESKKRFALSATGDIVKGRIIVAHLTNVVTSAINQTTSLQFVEQMV